MLWRFFAETTPDQVRPADVLAYAHGIGLSGRPPSPVTIGARIACLSSYYRFLIRMGLADLEPLRHRRAAAGSPSPPGATRPTRSGGCWRSCPTRSRDGGTGPSSSSSS